MVDESAGIALHRRLLPEGYDSKSVMEEMEGAEDEEVSRLSREEGRILITCDKDFGLLALSYGLPGLILLRLRDERAENKIRRTLDAIGRFGSNLRSPDRDLGR